MSDATQNSKPHGTTMLPSHAEENRVQGYHTQEWSSGSRGGGKLPADFGWHTNPKQWQEELGSAAIPGTPQGSSK